MVYTVMHCCLNIQGFSEVLLCNFGFRMNYVYSINLKLINKLVNCILYIMFNSNYTINKILRTWHV